MTVVLGVETVVLVIVVFLVFGLLRAYASVLQRLHALESGQGAPGGEPGFRMLPVTAKEPVTHPIGVVGIDAEFPLAHDIAGTTLDGETVVLRTADVEHDTLLLFLSSGCSTCATFWADLAGPINVPARTRLVVVAQDRETESVVSLRDLAPSDIDVILSSAAWSDYGVPGSPYVVAVNGMTGQVRGEGTGQSWAQIAELLTRASGDPAYLTTPASTAGRPSGDVARESDVDRELIRAGLLPGDPRLYGGTG